MSPNHPVNDTSDREAVGLGYARAPDGRVGTLIGFYKRAEESVVIRFASGECAEYPKPEVELFT